MRERERYPQTVEVRSINVYACNMLKVKREEIGEMFVEKK